MLEQEKSVKSSAPEKKGAEETSCAELTITSILCPSEPL